jgi:hypothetical protein
LIRIIDRVGWKQIGNTRQNNTKENVVEIAWRFFGEHNFKNKGMLETLCREERGPLGWYDLLLFRLQCSADRRGQLHEISKALIYNQNENAINTGQVAQLTILEMRKMSQFVAAKFISVFVHPNRNFFQEVSTMSRDGFFGKYNTLGEFESLDEQIEREKTLLASFIIYQLANTKGPNVSGIGCGFYDLSGDADGQEIASLISEYVFGFCFNPEKNPDNILFFLDHCLAHLSNSFFSDDEDDGYVPVKGEISGGLCNSNLAKYWKENKELIGQVAEKNKDRKV